MRYLVCVGKATVDGTFDLDEAEVLVAAAKNTGLPVVVKPVRTREYGDSMYGSLHV